MNLIALLTDFGLKDNFAGVMKGVIYKINSQAKIVDITHNIHSHSIAEASFLLQSSFSYFPKRTVFLVIIDPGVGSKRKAVAIKTKKYYFVGPDNGVLSRAAGEDGIERAVILDNRKYFLSKISSTFHGRDIFAPAAAYLSKGISFSLLGKDIDKIKKINLPRPKIKNNILEAEIIYIDKFGNLITNIEKDFMLSFLKGKSFFACLNNKEIAKLCSTYAEGSSRKPFFIEGSFGYLEISLKEGSAQEYFKLRHKEKAVLTVKRARK